MVKAATGLGRSGLQDWLIQRISAVVLAFYMIFLCSRIFLNSHHNYAAWHDLFHSHWVKMATLLALLSLIAHAWIGLWTITTDYLKPLYIRLPIQLVVILSLGLYLVWGMCILWGI